MEADDSFRLYGEPKIPYARSRLNFTLWDTEGCENEVCEQLQIKTTGAMTAEQ